MNTEKEWWEENLRRLFHNVWGASPWNELRMTDTSIEVVKSFFREQKKRDWEEFREMVDNYTGFEPDNVVGVTSDREAILRMIDSKLKEL